MWAKFCDVTDMRLKTGDALPRTQAYIAFDLDAILHENFMPPIQHGSSALKEREQQR